MCILNVNGVGYMLLGAGQVASAPLAALCFVLLLLTRVRIPVLAAWYALTVATFLFLAIVASLLRGRGIEVMSLIGPVGSALIASSVASALVWADVRTRHLFLRWVGVLLVIASIATLCSPMLYGIYLNPPPDSARFGGFFGNPNEAGIIGCIGLGYNLTLASRPEWRLVHLVCALVCLAAVVASFSKASILAAGVLVLGFLALRGLRRWASMFLALAAGFAALGVVSGLGLDDLEDRQLNRLQQVSRIAQLQFDTETVTNRDRTWRAALEEIERNFAVVGSGLNAMRQIEGGLYEVDPSTGVGSYRGAHNHWLVLVGEAGLLPALMMAALVVAIFTRVLSGDPYRFFILSYIIPFLADTMSSHNIFELRFHSLLFGVTLALAQIHAGKGVIGYAAIQQKGGST